MSDTNTKPCCGCGAPTDVPDGYELLLEMAQLAEQFHSRFNGPPVTCQACDEKSIDEAYAKTDAELAEDLLDRTNIPATMPDGDMGPGFEMFLRGEMPKPGMFIHGKTGAGKTFKACQFVRAWCRQKLRPALYRTEPEVFRRLRDFKGEADDETKRLASIPLLIIDDLGASYDNQKGWVAEKLFEIIDARYQDQRLRTVIISNASLDELVENERITYIDARIRRRIQEICHVIKSNDQQDAA